MARFVFGLFLGTISGAATYVLSGSGQLAALLGALAAVLTWCGVLSIIIGDD